MSERPTVIRFRDDVYQPDGDIYWTRLVPGDVVIHPYTALNDPTIRRELWICCPGGKAEGEAEFHLGSTAKHEHEWHADGSVTVNPSLLCSCGAHYFIRANRIEYC